VPEHDRAEVEARLFARRDEVDRLLAALLRDRNGGLDSELSHLDNHPADEGTETHDVELQAGAELHLQEESERIREALAALADGTYGTCRDCGTEIPADRLAAQPDAVRCLPCQRRFEATHRQRATL
jgi:RNA polymerase-binding transcription factor DksA